MEVSAWLSVRNSPARAVRGAQNTTACRGRRAETEQYSTHRAIEPLFQHPL